MSRLGLALVLILFCLPLFVGLRSLDLETDEAIYSFAVDKMLEDGEWLQPKSSPSETLVFLEKPPLKFWIVAAPIRAGLLPHDEFGLRFWDALFGAIAFAYVFAIGSRLAGPVCGAVATMVLFVHWPLMFEHGLRSNSMEGPLVLAYCGGIYHFLSWGGRRESRRGVHALAVGLYFVLGFMTKFVAIVFLPAVIGLGSLLVAPVRQRLWHDWRRLAAVLGVALLLIAPWFLYAQLQFGSLLWETMLGEHVYVRFTAGMIPAHVQAWDYYLTTGWEKFSIAGVQWFVPLGLAVLALQSVRRRWFEGLVILLWAVMPLAAISFGSSKLYHYTYPFLPPVALAMGYVAALVMMLGPPLLTRMLNRVDDLVMPPLARVVALTSGSAFRTAVSVLFWAATILAVWTLVFGQVRLAFGGTTLFKSSGMVRPLIIVVLAGMVSRQGQRAAMVTMALLVAWVLPIEPYRAVVHQLTVQKHPLRNAASCIQRVESASGGAPRGMFIDAEQGRWLEGLNNNWHPMYYYFRRIQPWTIQNAPLAASLERALHDPQEMRPAIVQDARYRSYLDGAEGDALRRGGSPPIIGFFGYSLLLPGPYRTCSPEAGLLATP